MKTFYLFILSLISIVFLAACQKEETAHVKVGIVLPIEHQALQEIVAGFTEKLHQLYHQPVQIKMMNAQNDANLQRAIIQQMQENHFNLIVPVGTATSQMAAAMIHDQPILSLAADFSENERKQRGNLAAVHDEIPPQRLMAFIHAAYPQLTRLTLIHSSADKVFPDVKKTIAAGLEYDIDVKPLMAATLPDLVTIAQSIPKDTQAIFVLKDNLIVSGISVLAKTAQEKHIPLFTSDQGSVEAGAAFSLGVHEKQIGEEGAKLAAEILSGKSANSLPTVEMDKLIVFINKDALQKEQQSAAQIADAAKNLNYNAEFVGEKK